MKDNLCNVATATCLCHFCLFWRKGRSCDCE